MSSWLLRRFDKETVLDERLTSLLQIDGAFNDLSLTTSAISAIVSTIISEGKATVTEGLDIRGSYSFAAFFSTYLLETTRSLAQDVSDAIGMTE
jgi:hypothetical protein